MNLLITMYSKVGSQVENPWFCDLHLKAIESSNKLCANFKKSIEHKLTLSHRLQSANDLFACQEPLYSRKSVIFLSR